MATKREELSAGAKTKEDEETFDVLRSFLTINDVNDKEHPDEIVRDSTIGIILQHMTPPVQLSLGSSGFFQRIRMSKLKSEKSLTPISQ
jgi:hypothetical protein